MGVRNASEYAIDVISYQKGVTEKIKQLKKAFDEGVSFSEFKKEKTDE